MTTTQRRTGSGQAKPGTRAVRPVRSGLIPSARRHRAALVTGLAFTLLLVTCRLMLPLPLGALVRDSASPAAGGSGGGNATRLAAGFVALTLVSGLADYVSRLQFANFVNRTVGDARDAATRGLGATAATGRAAQVVADSARVKQGLKGLLNHVVLNLLLVVGAAVAVLITAPRLGLCLVAGLVVLIAVGTVGTVRVGRIAERHRGDEATLAAAVHDFAVSERVPERAAEIRRMHDLDETSGRADVGLTQGEGRCTSVAHVVLTVTFAVVLFLGTSDAAAGRLTNAELFTVGGYLLVLHGPGVRLCRQMCRMGVVLVPARHLGHAVCRARVGAS